jgi:hypothetical protein
MGHDNGPPINAAIKASCDANNRCGTVYTPYESTLFPVATPIVALRGQGLILLGGASPIVAEPSSAAPSGWVWTGALGGTMLELNQQTKPQVANLSFQSGVNGVTGSTMGVTIDMDGFDPGDGQGVSVTSTRPTFRDIYTGQASVGIRFANINPSNVEFGVIEGSVINWVYGTTYNASNIGLLINSGNSLATRLDGSTIAASIGVWSNIGGFSAIQTQTAQADGIGIFLGAGYGHPVTIDTSRNEHLARFVYGAVTQPGTASGTQITLRGNTLTDIRLPSDGDFITLTGGEAAVLDGNEFFLAQDGTDNDYITPQFPGGIIREVGSGALEAHGNFWGSICGDPYSFLSTVNTSGDMCSAASNTPQAIPAYFRGDNGVSIGTPTSGAMGEGTLNLSGLLFHNGQPLVNWGEASIASIAASASSFATVNWNTPFGDSNYDFSCIVVDGAGFLTVLGSNAKSATSVGFQVKNNDASAAHSGTANCTAVHH